MSIYHREGLYTAPGVSGQGLYCRGLLPAGERILTLIGPQVSKSALPNPYPENDDAYIQVGPQLYLGPFFGVERFVNHSCDPNAAYLIHGAEVYLTTLRAIPSGQEICYDYSTTMDEDEFEMDCRCGTGRCRSRVRDFKYLPESLKSHYLELGIVPDFLLQTR